MTTRQTFRGLSPRGANRNPSQFQERTACSKPERQETGPPAASQPQASCGWALSGDCSTQPEATSTALRAQLTDLPFGGSGICPVPVGKWPDTVDLFYLLPSKPYYCIRVATGHAQNKCPPNLPLCPLG